MTDTRKSIFIAWTRGEVPLEEARERVASIPEAAAFYDIDGVTIEGEDDNATITIQMGIGTDYTEDQFNRFFFGDGSEALTR